MGKPAWDTSWARMRGIGRHRQWMTWGEFDGLLRTLGVRLTPYHACLALAQSPPVKVNGAKQYLDRHVEMAVGYARARRWIA